MSYQLKVIKDHPVGFWPLDESIGTDVIDISGCGNTGTYHGGIKKSLIPLVSGGVSSNVINSSKYISLPVTKDYSGSNASGGFADYNSSDNDFSLEVWLYPKITTSSVTPIFADSTNNIGIYYESGNVIFKLEGESVDYTLPHIKQSHHIVAVYSKSEISLWINGKFAAKKTLNNFKFTAQSVSFQVGPTANASDSFIIDAPAVYRYALGLDRISSHYIYSGTTSPYQIAVPESGSIFEVFDDGTNKQFTLAYPANRPFEYFLTEDLNYNLEEKYLEVKKTAIAGSKSVVINDAIAIPGGFDLKSSKIEWSGSNGISVSTSTDQSTWIECINGLSIPQFKLNDNGFSSDRILYIKITMSSSDTSRFNPRLSSLIIRFYSDQILYSQNTADYISATNELIKEISMGRINMPILSRHSLNGLKTGIGAGFKINTQDKIMATEFFATFSSLSTNSLFSTQSGTGLAATQYSWNSGGTITKTNISAIYVNGVDQTSKTLISDVFETDELYHIILVFSSACSTPQFNLGGPSNLYQYISCYPNVVSQQTALNHYNMHIGRASAVADDSSMSMTENSVNFYNNDWIVLQSR